MWDRWIAGLGREPLSPSDCVYEVFRGERCVGTVFFDSPRDLRTILDEVGVKRVEGLPERGATIPCNRAVRLLENPPGYRLEMMSGNHLLCAGQRIDINLADKTALTAVPWIGPRLADNIVAYRVRHGPYARVDELQRVRGIGRRQLARIRPFLQVGPTRVMAPVSALPAPPEYP